MSNNTIRRRHKSVGTIDDHQTVEYNWTEEMTKEQEQNERHSTMHAKLLRKYQKEAPQLLEDRIGTANELNEQRFWQIVDNSGAKVEKQITSIYRTKVGNKEYFFYGEELRSTDNLGNPIDHFHQIGKYEDPQFVYTMGPGGQKLGTSINGFKTVFELKWPSDWTKSLEKNLINETQFYLKTDSSTSGGRGITYTIGKYEDFKNRTYDELLMLGKYGVIAPSADEIFKIEKSRQERKR
jgi:hypothetical protein